MEPQRSTARALTLVIFALIAPTLALAQEARGTITGRVTDTQGAILPGLSVEVVNAQTSVRVSVTTNAQGNYSIPYLNPGPYSVTFKLAGFKTAMRKVDLRVADTLAVNAVLEVGEFAETVVVEGAAALLDSQTSSLGQVVDAQRIQDLPLRERNPWELVLLAPGVQNTTDLRFRKAGMTRSQSQFQADGAGGSNDFAIDGVPNMSTFNGNGGLTVAFAPPASSVQEFRVQTAAYDASIGNISGASVTVMSKSGANAFHGGADFYYRSSGLDAQNVFEQRAGQPKKEYLDRLFGASIGGPLRKDKTFFFAAFDGNPYGVPRSVGNRTVPTEKMRRGDFSELLALGPQYQIYDPATTRVDPTTPGRFIRDPLPGNIIPAGRLDPMALRILGFVPLPNAAGTIDGRENFVVERSIEDQSRYVVTTRLDHTFSDRHRAFARVSFDWWKNTKDDFYDNEANGFAEKRRNRQFGLDDTYMLSSSLVLNTRAGLAWQWFPQGSNTQGFDLAGLGFVPSVAGLYDAGTATFPRVDAGTFDLKQGSSAEQFFNDYKTKVYSLGATLNWVKGRHSLRFGPEVRAFGEQNAQTQTSPELIYNNNWTRGPRDNSPGSPYGQELATFMMGYLTGGSTQINPERNEWITRFAFFGQDDWKISKSLTLNLGLRWEYETPLIEKNDAMVNGFDFATSLPIEAAAMANYAARSARDMPPDIDYKVRGGYLFASKDGRRRGLFKPIYTNVMPRAGFAYTFGSTVVRGGWGMFYDSLAHGTVNANQAGYSRVTPIIPSLDNGRTFVATPANPFPNGLLQPVGNSLGLMTNVGAGVNFPYVDRIKSPLTHRFSLGFQRELPGRFKLEVNYVGSRQSNQPVSVDLNAVPARYLSTLPTRDQATNDYLTSNVSNPLFGIPQVTAGMTGATVARQQLLRPYPQYTSISAQETTGKAWYNSVQVSLDRRFANGFTAQASYTYSRTMEALSYLNPTDTELHKVIGAQDRPHVLVVSGLLNLPFGKGRKFGNDWGGLTEILLGGWQFGTLYRTQVGTPLGFGNFLFKPGYTIADVSKSRRQQTGDAIFAGLPPNAAFTNPWFNTEPFETEAAVQLVSNIRTQPARFAEVRAPGYTLLDASLSKTISFSDTLRIKLRFQGFNLLNKVNLRPPSTSVTASTFGVSTALNGYPRQFQLGATFEF